MQNFYIADTGENATSADITTKNAVCALVDRAALWHIFIENPKYLHYMVPKPTKCLITQTDGTEDSSHIKF